MASTRGVAKAAYFASATDATVNSSASDWSRSRSESSPAGPSSATVSSSDTRSSASNFPVAEALFSGGRQGAEYLGLGKDAGWGLEVLSLQRDWAHVEWRADALVPDGSENGADPRTCPSEVGAQDAFELRAAVVTQVTVIKPSSRGRQQRYRRLLEFRKVFQDKIKEGLGIRTLGWGYTLRVDHKKGTLCTLFFCYP